MSSAETTAYIAEFSRFIQASPSSYHAAAEVAGRLVQAGFTRLSESESWPADPAGGRYVVVRDGAVMAWVAPAAASATTPFRVLGTHTDSPGFKLKPKPSIGSFGWLQAAVEIYGGPLLNSWLDRELELAGRVVMSDGTEQLVRTGPWLRIPQLAIHLDRDVSKGLTLDRQRHVQPVYGAGSDGDVLGDLADILGVDAAEITGYDIMVADTNAPARFGADEALFAAGRMDNLSSVFAGLVALLDAAENADSNGEYAAPHISVLAAFDHEELGSETRSGASGPFLADVLSRISLGLGASEEERMRAIADSWCVSSDAGHAVHPNYSEKHDPNVQPVFGGGTLLKINSNQRYATDAHGAALVARLAAASGANYQEFVSNNAMPCGSTIGPLTATRLGIRTVDVGTPLLSMHSARELAHVDDLYALSRLAGAFFDGV